MNNNVSCVGFDPGNSFAKVCQDGSAQKFLSCISEVINTSDFEDCNFGLDSALIEYLDGDRQDLKGQNWVLGKLANEYQKDYVQNISDSVGSSDKATLGLQFLLAGMRPKIDGLPVQVPYLYASVPNTKTLKDKLINNLKGTHVIRKNKGQVFKVQIGEVKVLGEGQGALVYGLSKRQGNGEGEYFATLDIGYGTAISQVYRRNGEPLGIGNNRKVLETGVRTLLDNLAKDDLFLTKLNRTADVELLKTAVEKATLNGIYSYGANPSIDFKNAFEKHHRNWLTSIAKPLVKNLETHWDNIGSIFLIGGGSNLAGQLAKGKIIKLPEPQMANVKGLWILSRGKTREVVAAA